MYIRGYVHSAKCTFWQVSIQRNAFLESVFLGTVFLGGVSIPLEIPRTLGQWFSTGGPQKYFAVGHRAFWFEKVVFAQ